MHCQVEGTSVLNTQCGNSMIFLSLRFYVKSILEILEVQNLPFLAILEALNFIFGTFQLSKSAKMLRIQNSVPLNLLK